MQASAMADQASAPFTQGLQQGVLRYQRCDDCGAAQTLTRYACVRCGSVRLRWRDAVGTGTVFAVTRVTRAPSSAFQALVPYALVLVDLDEGFRLMGQGVADLVIGQRVRAGFIHHEGHRLAVFQPADAEQCAGPQK